MSEKIYRRGGAGYVVESAARVREAVEDEWVANIALDEGDVGNGLHGEEVKGDDGAAELGGDLRPAAGGGAEIEDEAGEDGMLLVDLEELEGSARAVVELE